MAERNWSCSWSVDFLLRRLRAYPQHESCTGPVCLCSQAETSEQLSLFLRFRCTRLPCSHHPTESLGTGSFLQALALHHGIACEICHIVLRPGADRTEGTSQHIRNEQKQSTALHVPLRFTRCRQSKCNPKCNWGTLRGFTKKYLALNPNGSQNAPQLQNFVVLCPKKNSWKGFAQRVSLDAALDEPKCTTWVFFGRLGF